MTAVPSGIDYIDREHRKTSFRGKVLIDVHKNRYRSHRNQPSFGHPSTDVRTDGRQLHRDQVLLIDAGKIRIAVLRNLDQSDNSSQWIVGNLGRFNLGTITPVDRQRVLILRAGTVETDRQPNRRSFQNRVRREIQVQVGRRRIQDNHRTLTKSNDRLFSLRIARPDGQVIGTVVRIGMSRGEQAAMNGDARRRVAGTIAPVDFDGDIIPEIGTRNRSGQ